ncbi:O-antigen ligase family protein [Haliangium ochraceum]|uniref:O-antigen polymerase n=1 Tax=Haliangium ochraceum (strain DSM 14365 / JCM 11303 / SMP-2) TaxID=502025 RepID=D0LQG0_HALO1|nr:O-antigen ligase family protein [Haliangium ochraceum]ACY18969.1 O-antigen polymerase [Haliangium ochraceum DSM 14365]
MRRRDLVALLAIALSLSLSLAALGGVPRWAACTGAALGLACALPYLGARRRIDARAPLVLAAGFAALATAVQCLPLPAGLVAWLSPARHAASAEVARLLGEPLPGFLALSHEPAATLVHLASAAGLLALAYAAVRVAGRRSGALWLMRIAAGCGAAMALCALIHGFFGVDALFGVYRPSQATPAFPAPLLNDNHLAGFLSLCAPLALALAVARPGAERAGWLLAVLAIAATNLLVASRIGALSLCAGLLVAGALLVAEAQRRPGRRIERAVLIPGAIIAACAAVLVVSSAGARVGQELAETTRAELDDPRSKFQVWQRSIDLVSEHLWTGVGSGGFEPTFTRLDGTSIKTYSHLENAYLQILVDFGAPLAAGFAILGLWLALAALQRRRQDPLCAGALAGCTATAVHACGDFHLALPGVAATLVIVLAVLVPARLRSPAPRRRVLTPRIAGLLLGAGAVALAASPLGQGARAAEDRVRAELDRSSELRARGEREGAAAAETRALRIGRAQVARHPSDYLLAGLLAEAHFRRRDPASVAWINRALQLNPSHAGLHVLAARMLLTAGHRDQALLEYAAALRHTLTPRPLLGDLVRWFADPSEAARGIPASRERLPILSSWLLAMERGDVALAYARRVYAEHADDHEVQRVVADLAWRQGDHVLARSAAEPAYAATGALAEALILGQALHAQGREDEAARVLVEAIAARRYDELWQLTRAHQVLAEVEDARGDPLAARTHLRTAIRLAPAHAGPAVRADLQRRLARLEERLGNRSAAAQARALAAELDALSEAVREP